jgi:hypothetical protein
VCGIKDNLMKIHTVYNILYVMGKWQNE